MVLSFLCGLVVGSIAVASLIGTNASDAAPVAITTKAAAQPLDLGALKALTTWNDDSLRASIVEIQSNWNGTASVQTAYSSASTTVSVWSRCTAWFVKAGEHPVLVTNAHCVNDPDIQNKLLQDAYGKLPQIPVAPSKGAPVSPGKGGGIGIGGSLSEPTLSGDNIAPISQEIQIRPTLDSIKTSGMQATRLDLIDTQETKEGDLALLEASGPIPGIKPLAVAATVPATGSGITSIGYPADISSESVDGYDSAVFPTGTVIGQGVYQDGFKVTYVSSAFGHGMSGGPTVDRFGNVVGQNTMINSGQQLNIITNTGDLRRYLSKHDISAGTPSTIPLQNK